MDLDFRRCSISQRDLLIGLPPDAARGRLAVESLPENLKSILFLEGPEQADLISDFVGTPAAAVVENMMIGTSHDYISADRAPPYDFADAVGALKGANMPSLKVLSLGDMELLFNGHGYYGRVGDITHVFHIAPHLEELRIFGNAEISGAVQHDGLRRLFVTVDDIAGHCEPMTETTFTSLSTSRFVQLTECELSLEADGAPSYQIPDIFFSEGRYPALEAISIDSLAPADAIRLSAWKASRGLRW